MSIPSLSRPLLAVWPILPAGTPAFMRFRAEPMHDSAHDAATPDNRTSVDDDADPTAAIDDGQHDASSDMDFEEEELDVAPDEVEPFTIEHDALHVPLLTDLGGDESKILSEDVEMLTVSGEEDRPGSEDEPAENGAAVDAATQALVKDNDRLTHAVASQYVIKLFVSLEPELETRQATIQELRKQLQLAATQRAATEQRLLVVSQDLAASRSFVSREDVDGQQLRLLFNDVNEGVDDHTFLLLDAFPDPAEGATLDMHSALGLLDSTELVRKELYHLVSASALHGMALADFSALYIPALFNAVLLRVVFRPFIPGLDAARSAHLQACYENICQREPQDRAARWRSITYAQANPDRDDAVIVSQAVDLFCSALEASLPHLYSTNADIISSLRTQYSGAAAKIVRDALKLQDLAMATYISYDYRLIAPAADAILPAAYAEVGEMLKHCPHFVSRAEPAEDGPVTLAVVSFGLLASKGVQQNPSNVVERVVTVIKKASVVAARCHWAPAHIS